MMSSFESRLSNIPVNVGYDHGTVPTDPGPLRRILDALAAKVTGVTIPVDVGHLILPGINPAPCSDRTGW
jgi:hypothetical protein